nr:uncharacterized protein LOC117280414 [Nicotiana tomentosiformis]
MEKAKRKNQTSFPKSPQRQTDQQVDYVQEIHFPRPDASTTMELAEGSFPPWCPSQLSQGSSHRSLTQLLRMHQRLGLFDRLYAIKKSNIAPEVLEFVCPVLWSLEFKNTSLMRIIIGFGDIATI